MVSPSIVVVICTYNNARSLGATLASVQAQQIPTEVRWSVLLVDNNCTDDTQVVAEAFKDAGVPLRIVREPRQGLTAARLRGVLSSTEDWVAFVDDDCILDIDWVANAATFAASHPDIGGFGGRVTLEWEEAPPEYVDHFRYCFAEQELGTDERSVHCLVGAGLVVNRVVLARTGWIESPLLDDRTGRRLVSGGDVELALRLGAHHELRYEPACRLRHRIPMRRVERLYLARLNHGLGSSGLLRGTMEWGVQGTQWVRRALKGAFGHLRMAARDLRVAVHRPDGLTVAALRMAFCLGRIRAFIRLGTSEHRLRKALSLHGIAQGPDGRGGCQP